MTSIGRPLPIETRTLTAPPGRQLAAGRDATIYDLDHDRILRRTRDGRCMRHEAEVMEHVRGAGYPVPRVYRVGRGEIEMDRVDGLTMLADLLRHPWRLSRHARLLANLHERLHQLPPPPTIRPGPVAGVALVHLDLHPGNIILGPRGPVVIDWPHAALGCPLSDIAFTWTSLACFEHDATGLIARLADRFRAVFLDCFLTASCSPAAVRPLLPAMVHYRLSHPQRRRNVRAAEQLSLERLAAEATAP
ncbi:MAG: phosphotransferase [Actinomycetota bacterium]|nr:phosphotransferase [Actinomycetota bacterium]